MARLRLAGFNASNRRKANWVLGSVEFSPETARWRGSVFEGLRSQEKMEDIEKFSRWLSLLSGGIITGTVAGLLAQREGASCRLYANKLNCHAIDGQARPRGLRNIKNSPGRFGAWSIRIVTVESDEDPRLYNSQALVPDVS